MGTHTRLSPFMPFEAGVGRSFGMLSSFPPTACGIASFSAALAAGLVANGGTVDVVRCGATPDVEDALVLASLDDGGPSRVAAAIDVLNSTDVAIIQHEYGIYHGVDGDAVLDVLDGVVVPSTLLAAGHLLARPDVVEDGLSLLRWLLDRETVDGHLSPTPVDGAGRDDRPAFDQQPIEVAAMADACARAEVVTGDADWRRGIDLAIRWFAGDNDARAVMWNPHTGGGYDGLQTSGPNLNHGAESTIALISTLQHARLLESAA